MFGAEGGPAAQIAAPLVAPAALVTLAVGAAGVLASRSLSDLTCFAVVWSMGSLLVAAALPDVGGLTAALYYTLHSTLAGAALFLIADIVAARRGRWRDRLAESPGMAQASAVGGVFFLAAIAMAGLPPLSGFVGKVMILDASRDAPAAAWIWAVLLGTSLLVIVGFARAGSLLFWKSGAAAAAAADGDAPEKGPARPRAAPMAAAALLVAGTALLTVFAGPVTRQLEAAARQALDPAAYVGAVLGPVPEARLSGR
jgi:multicomponent K+:H+ antiporter subunit D